MKFEEYLDSLRNKSVAVIGIGVSNRPLIRLLLERGYKVLTLSHLPAHDLDLSADHPNLYWPFGQHILSGAKLVAHHPNLYAVYLTNHGCGPDTTLSYHNSIICIPFDPGIWIRSIISRIIRSIY